MRTPAINPEYLSVNSIGCQNEVSLALSVAISLVCRECSFEKATLNLLQVKTQLQSTCFQYKTQSAFISCLIQNTELSGGTKRAGKILVYVQALLHTCQCSYKIFTCSHARLQISTVHAQPCGLCVCAAVHPYTHLSGTLHVSNNGCAVLLFSFLVTLKAGSYLVKSVFGRQACYKK